MISRHVVFRALRPSTPTLVGTTTQRRLLTSPPKTTRPEDAKASLQNVNANKSKASSASSEDESSLPDKVRAMMRRIPHPLTVITAQSVHSSLPSGLLVSSFNTITLSPSPYVSLNLKLPSSTYLEIQQSQTFVASAISSVQLARDFLLDKKDRRFPIALRNNVRDGDSRLKSGRGGIWWMRCQYMERESVQVADHVVVIGKVTETGFYSNDSRDAGSAHGSPLIYSEGKYRVAGEAIQ
ncbi:MAG: hypothetical protein Q9211_001906 [Gyalolechia sp. 1 TL-2023]